MNLRPLVYRSIQSVLGAGTAYRSFVQSYIAPTRHLRFLDLGCGQAPILSHLTDCQYLGVDIDESAIEAAKKQWGDRAQFICGPAESLKTDDLGQFDRVLSLGLLHHIDDDTAHAVAELSYSFLNAGGQWITLDPVITARRNIIASLLIHLDRGRFVRRLHEYEAFVHNKFRSVEIRIRTDLLRLPYNHIIMICTR